MRSLNSTGNTTTYRKIQSCSFNFLTVTECTAPRDFKALLHSVPVVFLAGGIQADKWPTLGRFIPSHGSEAAQGDTARWEKIKYSDHCLFKNMLPSRGKRGKEGDVLTGSHGKELWGNTGDTLQNLYCLVLYCCAYCLENSMDGLQLETFTNLASVEDKPKFL